MELKGEFKSISEVLDLLQIIALGKKSGTVVFRGKEGKILLYLHDGKIVNFDSNIPVIQKLKGKIQTKEASLEECINSTLHYISIWEEGEFQFTEGTVNKQKLGNGDTLNIIMNFTKEGDELPSHFLGILRKNPTFTFSKRLGTKQTTLDRRDWEIFVDLATKGEFLKEVLFSNVPFQDVVNRILRLIDAGVIEPVDKGKSAVKHKPAVVPSERLNRVKELLVEAMGPMGEFLIDETMEELGISDIPLNMVGKFIDVLTKKLPENCIIDGETCKERFKREFRKALIGGADEV